MGDRWSGRLMDLLGGRASKSGGGFYYAEVAGDRGPKCEEEVERLDGWIGHYSGERREPFRLAHLLLARAACGDGGGGFDFPSTIDEFLVRDAPPDLLR
ncbi:hypothetical protein QJS10_CPB12g00621 [Acorus calamus]|uniref:Uncharacterized protein n=1 Tax=Acorus calamus TaxID=4465 RepID=A0AAV9DPE7_ACOCL|nr:hypothetical protein QJS10_CPB12g00621 [Acorus calamus]